MLMTMNLDNLVLRPNCLLTKNPLVFIPGPRSLFFYQRPFGDLPRFLFEHGYVTSTLSLPFRGHRLRYLYFQNWLKLQSGKKFHFILDKISFDHMKNLLANPSTETVTVISINEHMRFENAQTWTPLVKSRPTFKYLLHQIFSNIFGTKTPSYSETFSDGNLVNYNRFLDHCIKLAENDIYA